MRDHISIARRQAYITSCTCSLHTLLVRWLKEWNKEGVAIDAKGVYAGERPQAVLPRRWIVERTFAWLS